MGHARRHGQPAAPASGLGAERVFLANVKGDGTADLLFVGDDYVLLAVNRQGTGSPRHCGLTTRLPPRRPDCQLRIFQERARWRALVVPSRCRRRRKATPLLPRFSEFRNPSELTEAD